MYAQCMHTHVLNNEGVNYSWYKTIAFSAMYIHCPSLQCVNYIHWLCSLSLSVCVAIHVLGSTIAVQHADVQYLLALYDKL